MKIHMNFLNFCAMSYHVVIILINDNSCGCKRYLGGETQLHTMFSYFRLSAHSFKCSFDLWNRRSGLHPHLGVVGEHKLQLLFLHEQCFLFRIFSVRVFCIRFQRFAFFVFSEWSLASPSSVGAASHSQVSVQSTSKRVKQRFSKTARLCRSVFGCRSANEWGDVN